MAIGKRPGKRPARKVRVWRCPKCGHKIVTSECVGCLVEAQQKKPVVAILSKEQIRDNLAADLIRKSQA